MFCPNCGKDCGSAKFCPECGTKLPQAAKKDAVWQVGIPCPNCGGNRLEGNYCAFCGTQMLLGTLDSNRSSNTTEIPLGIYEGCNGRLKLEENAVTLIRNHGSRSFSIRNMYAYLTKLIYYRPRGSRNGYLTIRWIGNTDFPMPDISELETDASTLAFSAERDLVFYHIYSLLKAIAPDSVQANIHDDQICSAALGMNGVVVNLNTYFDRYTPQRGLAATALANDIGISIPVARMYIDDYFDEQQQMLYDSNPNMAIRDMRCIVQNKTAQELIALRM